MLYHVSLEADDPRHVAQIFAEIWGGVAMPFHPVGEDSWCAFAGDERNTMIEFYPRGCELYETPGDADAHGAVSPNPRRHNGTHVALATDLDLEGVLRIAAREGWPAKYRKRDGVFGVIEMWVEGCQMVEWLTPSMVVEYLDHVTVDGWARAVGQAREMRMAA